MRDPRPGKEHKITDGTRRLLYDLRHKGSRAVALEHKATALAKGEAGSRSAREKAAWYGADTILKQTEGHDDSRNEMAADWPHKTSPDEYCSICACFGCRAASPKE